MEERRDTPPLVVVEHRHFSLTSPAPKHLHWSSPLRRFNAKYWHVNFQLSRIGRHESQGPGKRECFTGCAFSVRSDRRRGGLGGAGEAAWRRPPAGAADPVRLAE